MADELKHLTVGTILTQSEYEAVGGHVFDSQATGDIVYASSSSQLLRLGIGSSNTLLEVASGIPGWTSSPTIGSTSWANATHAHAASNSGGTIAITATTGTLAVGNGGTGATALTDKAVLISQDSGTDTLGSVALTTSGQVIIGGSSGPAAATLTAGSNITITNGDGSISIAAAAGGAVTLEGGHTSHASTNSGTRVALLTASSMSIALAEQTELQCLRAKTGGAAGIPASSIKIDGIDGSNVDWSDAVDETNNTLVRLYIGARIATYQSGNQIVMKDYRGALAAGKEITVSHGNNMPLGEIEEIIVMGGINQPGCTTSADELQVYSKTAA